MEHGKQVVPRPPGPPSSQPIGLGRSVVTYPCSRPVGLFRDALGMEQAFGSPGWAGFVLPSGQRDLLEVFGRTDIGDRVVPSELSTECSSLSRLMTLRLPGKTSPLPTSN
jgi:hypothetical protein